MSKTIADLGLRTATYNALMRAGVRTTDDLEVLYIDDLLLDVPSFGVGALADLMVCLNAAGLPMMVDHPYARLPKRETWAILGSALEHLPDREQVILAAYYRDGRTQVDIAHELDLTMERVGQLRRQALRRALRVVRPTHHAP